MIHKHKKIRITCKHCCGDHTANEERFHGEGSFKTTHKSYCAKRNRIGKNKGKLRCRDPKSKDYLRKRNYSSGNVFCGRKKR